MQKETLNLSAWEQIKEKVKRWFGKGEYGTARDFLNLHKMRENSIDLEFLLLTKEFKENGLKKDVYGTQYDLKQEFKDFEERKAKGDFVGANEQKALDFLEKYKLKLSALDSKVDELAHLKKEIATIKSVINGNDLDVKKETYKMIVETIYNNHYIRWYKEFLSEKDLKSYMVIIEQLKVKIFDNLNAEININGGIKPMNDYSEFNVGREIKNTTTILGIIFIFALITLLLGKAFDMSLLQTISFVIINTSMFFLVYSLVSKKGIEQFKLILKLFDKVK